MKSNIFSIERTIGIALLIFAIAALTGPHVGVLGWLDQYVVTAPVLAFSFCVAAIILLLWPKSRIVYQIATLPLLLYLLSSLPYALATHISLVQPIVNLICAILVVWVYSVRIHSGYYAGAK